MPDRHPSDYLLRRAVEAENKARAAKDPGVAAVHRALAQECRARAAELGVYPGD